MKYRSGEGLTSLQLADLLFQIADHLAESLEGDREVSFSSESELFKFFLNAPRSTLVRKQLKEKFDKAFYREERELINPPQFIILLTLAPQVNAEEAEALAEYLTEHDDRIILYQTELLELCLEEVDDGEATEATS